MKHLLILLFLFLLSSPLFGQSSKYKSVGQCILQTMKERELTGNKMFEMVKEECERILGKGETGVGKRNGEIQWTKQLGTSLNDSGYGVTTDLSGNIYVIGSTGGGLDGNTGSGEKDIVLIKYNSSGTKQWTNQLGTSSNDYGTGVTTDLSGNIYVTGVTYGGLDGNTSSGGEDIFLVKYNSSGTKQWTNQLGTSSSDYGTGVTTDLSGNIYVTGKTQGGLNGNTNSGDYDIFLVKYNSSGIKQ